MAIRLGAFLLLLAVWLANPAFAENSAFYVVGEVEEPGQFPLPEGQEVTFSQAIEMAGGIRRSGKATECFLHRRSVGTSVTVQKINLAAITQGTETDLLIQPNDTIYVSSFQLFFYVAGAVQEPGKFSLPRDRELTISKAVAMAGGASRAARLADCVLIRFHEDGSRREQQINLEAILRGQEPDFPIQDRDILFVPSKSGGRKHDSVDPPWIKRAELYSRPPV